MNALVNQVAVITGAGSGIGRAIALALAAEGARLCLVGRRLEALQALAQAMGRQAACFRADLSREHDAAGLAERVLHDVDGVAPYLITREFLPSLRSRRGQVLFVNSSAGLGAPANLSRYAESKQALKALADSLRDEVNADGVRVVSLFLGRTATPMQAAVFAMEGRTYRPELLMQPEDVAAVALMALTLPRRVEVTDITLRPLLKSY